MKKSNVLVWFLVVATLSFAGYVLIAIAGMVMTALGLPLETVETGMVWFAAAILLAGVLAFAAGLRNNSSNKLQMRAKLDAIHLQKYSHSA